MSLHSNKFGNFKYVDQIFRKHSIEIDRKNFYRFDRNERISQFLKKIFKFNKEKFKIRVFNDLP